MNFRQLICLHFKNCLALAIFVSVIKSKQKFDSKNRPKLVRFLIFWKFQVFFGSHVLYESCRREIRIFYYVNRDIH